MRKLLLLAPFAMFACVTPYQPAGVRGGYSDTQLGENVFRVDFNGNGYTTSTRAADFALLRGAELTLEHGYRFFRVADQRGSTAVGGSWGAYGGGVWSSPSTGTTVVCYSEKPTDAGPVVYEAEVVRKALRAKYDLQ